MSAGSGGLIVLLVLMAVESSAPGCCESVAEKTKMTAVGVRSKVTCVVGVVGVCSYISCLRILISMVWGGASSASIWWPIGIDSLYR